MEFVFKALQVSQQMVHFSKQIDKSSMENSLVQL